MLLSCFEKLVAFANYKLTVNNGLATAAHILFLVFLPNFEENFNGNRFKLGNSFRAAFFHYHLPVRIVLFGI